VVNLSDDLLTHAQKEPEMQATFTDAEVEQLLAAACLDPFWDFATAVPPSALTVRPDC
jgi:hypothetical protein